MALAQEGVNWSSTRAARTRSTRPRRDPAGDRRDVRGRGRGRHHAGRPAAVLAACPAPDILVNNAGGPPIGDFRDWDEAIWQKAVNDNMITPIMLIRAVVDGMIERKFGRIVNITSRSVKAPLAHLGLSNGARAGLTGFVAGLARQIAKHNVLINNLLPGPSPPTGRPTACASWRPRRDRITTASPRRGWRSVPADASALRRNSAGVRVPVQRGRRLHRRTEPAIDGGAVNLSM